MLAGDLLGRYHALADADAELGGERFAAHPGVLPSSPTTWPTRHTSAVERAVRFLDQKRLMTPAQYDALRDQYRSAGFKIAGVQNRTILGIARGAVAGALERGLDRKAGGRALNAALSRAGYGTLDPWHARLVAHMAVASGYGRAQWDALHDPRVRGIIPAFQLRTQEDARVRPAHAAMNRRIYPRTWSGWLVWWPPNGYNCRCYVVGVTKRTLDAYAIKPSTRWPSYTPEGARRAVRARPDEGFEGNPGTYIRQQSHPDATRAERRARDNARKRR